MPRRTPGEIVGLVADHENATRTRRDRMDADYDIWQLNELPQNGGENSKDTDPIIGDEYKHYISNEPRTFAEKVVSIGAASKVLFRVKGGKSAEPRAKRDKQNNKERFIIGVHYSGDERLRDLIQPSVQEQLAWFAPLRGWVAVRALLRKRKDGSTFTDIQPLDPRNTFWSIGPDGVEWVCVRTMKTTRDIRSIYGKNVEGDDSGDEDNGIAVYDFYDKVHNQVTTEQTVLKAATPHGSPRVPIWIGVVGSTPMVNREGIGGGNSSDFGESIYASDRRIYAYHNFLVSVILELMGRSRSPGSKFFSADGSKTTEGDLFKEGAEISLRRDTEDIVPLPLVETTKDAAAFAGFIQGEMQRGSLPHSVFGELQFQLSGFAINSLRQGVATIINPAIKAMENAYTGISNLLVDQYVTGKFKAMEVSGMDRNREYFSEEITPDEVASAGGRIVVEVLPTLPQDDPAKMNMAQMARTPGVDGKPLFGDRTVREDILNRQDPDSDAAVVVEQLADASSPLAQAVTTLEIATDLEREDLIFAAQAQILVVMRDMLKATGQAPQQDSPVAVPGMPSSVAPQQELGVPQGIPVPQQGPIVPPGQPRPGAQSIDDVLAG